MLALRLRLIGSVGASALALAPAALTANPLGGQVVGGAATIAGQGTSNVVVDQTTQRAIIDWRSFNIAPNETTQFVQPNSSSVTLNRVNGGLGASQINGMLNANGSVYVVNPDGILFGPSANVNVGSLLATTHDITNPDFMAGRGNFTIPGNPSASIVNQGTITAANGGFAALVAPGVRNDGVITANLGNVSLAAGNGFTLDLYGDNLITLQPGDAIAANVVDVATGQTLQSLVANTGKLKANGGTVSLTAVAAKRVLDSVINASGVIEANTVGTKNGLVVFGAATGNTKPAGAPTQTVRVSARIRAAGKKPGTTGGKIQITGENIQLAGAKLDVSGSAGGGTVLIGGDWGGGDPNFSLVSNPSAYLESYALPTATTTSVDASTVIDASATNAGNGGKVIVWSNSATSFQGTILAEGGAQSGQGGFVETSGHASLDFAGGRVDTSAANGPTGSWLLDPYDLTIDSNAAATLETNLATTNVTVETTANGYNGPGTAVQGSGDIDVAANISWSSANTLTLSAYHNINFDPGVVVANTGAGDLVLRSDNAGATGGGVFFNTNGSDYSVADFSQSTGAVSIFYNTNSIISVETNPNASNQLQLNLYGGQAAAAYMTGSVDPWGVLPSDPGSPDSAMNTAFGAGDWTKFYGFNAAALGGEYKFVYIDGGGITSPQFNSFVGHSSNIAALQNFVTAGGALYLNAAVWTAGTDPNNYVSGTIDVGFGATLTFDTDYSLASGYGTAVNPNNPIFTGPNGSAGTSWTGNYFSHDVVGGAGLQPLITGTSGTVLAGEHYGAGYVMIGSITSPFFQQPQPQANILRANILSYVASQYTFVPPVVIPPVLLPPELAAPVLAFGAQTAQAFLPPAKEAGCTVGAAAPNFDVNSAEREPSTQVAASPTWRKIESEVASAPLLRESLVVADLEEAQRQLKQELHGAENATALAQQRIGSAVIAHNQVDELAGASAARISVGDNVFSNETVRTAADSNGKFVFSDDTNLAMGPQSTVKLDRFVFSGEATYSKAALNLSEGAFRFITGISQKRAYDITTPTAVIGVRGTIVDIKVTKGLTTVALLEGRALVCPRGDQHDCTTLKPGQTAAVTLKKAALAHTSWTFASSCVGNSALCGQTTVAEAQTTGAQRVALGSPGAGTPCAP